MSAVQSRTYGGKAPLLCILEPLVKPCASGHDNRIKKKAPSNNNQIVINRNS